MKHLLYVPFFLLIMLSGGVCAQSNLPPCQGNNVATWNNCFGTHVFPSGAKYIGEYRDAKFHGKGEYTYFNGNKYSGDYRDGRYHGQGTYTFTNGEKYVGEFRDGVISGKGSYFYKNGEKYVGEFSWGQPSGFGILYAITGSVVYKGKWEHGKFVTALNTDLSTTSSNFSQLDNFSSNLPACKGDTLALWKNCFGFYVYDNGSEYVGEFRNGAPHGRGSLTSPNGSKYVGNWINGLRHGAGIQTYADSRQTQSGTWNNGVFSGDKILITKPDDSAIKPQSQSQANLTAVGSPSLSSQSGNTAIFTSNKRLALVIGNASYKVRPLLNPRNDADDVSRVLRGTGFEVIDLRDATLAQMRLAVRQFGERLMSNDVGLVYYSGHGIEVKGKNYFIPINADIKASDEVADQALDVSLILAKMDTAKKGVNILIVDACRDDPFGRSFRSNSRGLATMDAPQGTLIAYATAPGSVAADGTGRNSPFTKHLVRAMQVPNTPIELMFKEVRRAVREETKNQQTPWENSSLIGNFYFSVKK